LPKLSENDLKEAYDLVEKTNFSQDVVEKNLFKIESDEACFRLIKVEGAIEKFGNYDKCSSGKLMLDFFQFCQSHKGCFSILDDQKEQEHFPYQFIVKQLFSQTHYITLLSTSATVP
jgi:hypothetical protein